MLLGQVSEEDKARVYHSVDVFCAPNTGGESFGIVLAEAMAAGAPIVASDLDAFRQVLRGGQAGELFETGDPAALAAAAGRLLDDPARRAALSAAAAEAVRAYDWPVVARDVVRVYEAVVAAYGQVGRPVIPVRARQSARHADRRHPHRGRGRAHRRLRVLAGRPAGPAARPGRGGPGRPGRRAGPAQLGGAGTGRLRAARPGHQPAAGRRRARRPGRGRARPSWPRAT